MGNFAAKAVTQKRFSCLWMHPSIYANEELWHKVPAGFFKSFPDYGIDKTFIFFNMTGRLVNKYLIIDLLFNKQKFIIMFDDGRDGDVWLPTIY